VTRELLLVMGGGAVGSVLRHLAQVGAARAFGNWLPWGTLGVNVLGSLLLGVVVALWPTPSAEQRLLLGTGLLGGFTTYSSFNAELLQTIEAGQLGKAALYLFVTVAVALAAGALGLWLGRSLQG
jgi:fluoride exporter